MIKNLLRKLGNFTTRKGGQEYIFTCPDCRRPKLEVNLKKKVYYCFYCSKGGRLEPGKDNLAQGGPHQALPMKTEPVGIPGMVLKPLPDSFRGVPIDRMMAQGWCYSADFKLRNRLIIPIWENGKIVCYAARALKGQEPKELYPPATVSNKSSYLYGYDDVPMYETIVLVEGIFDCEAVRRAGFFCMASLGSHLSGVQIGKILKKKPSGIILMYDGDLAGREGMFKAWKDLRERYAGPICPIWLTEGMDPDDLDSGTMTRLIKMSQP